MKKSIWLSILASGLLVIFLGSVVCSQEIPGKEVLDRITDSKVLHYHTMPGILARSKGDILEIFKYVRDEVAFESYQGSLRGVDGTLQARAGNSWDQAILLKALLDELGVACKLVRSRLPREYYQELKASSLLPAKAEKLLPDGFVKELKIGAKAGAEFNQSIAGYMGEVVKEAIAEHANINFQPLKMSSPAMPYSWVIICGFRRKLKKRSMIFIQSFQREQPWCLTQ